MAEDRTGTLDRLADEVGSSMIQQRERLLDLCEEMLQGIVDEHCPPNAHAEDWDLDALRRGDQGALQLRAHHRRDQDAWSASRS